MSEKSAPNISESSRVRRLNVPLESDPAGGVVGVGRHGRAA